MLPLNSDFTLAQSCTVPELKVGLHGWPWMFADSHWRNRSEFLQGTEAIVSFLTRKWEKEHDYRLRKYLWAFDEDKIAVRFEYEFHDASGQWWRAHGNEVCGMCQHSFPGL